jgi:adenylylsulfate kinase
MKNKQVIWIMGPTSSGKTTIANQLINELRKKGIPSIHYDGDEVRDFFGENLGFQKTDRLKVVKTIVHLSNKALESGLNVIVSALTANEDARSYILRNMKNLVLVSLECNIQECIKRDPKGIYKKAISGEIKTLVGYNSEYLTPENPDIVIDTENNTVDECVKNIAVVMK